jgi:hypothetical protein
MKRHFGTTYRLHRLCDENRWAKNNDSSNRRKMRRYTMYIVSIYNIFIAYFRGVRPLLVIANVLPNSPIFVTLMMVLRSSETSVPTRATRRNILQDGIFHSHYRKNFKFLRNSKIFRNVFIMNMRPKEDLWFSRRGL